MKGSPVHCVLSRAHSFPCASAVLYHAVAALEDRATLGSDPSTQAAAIRHGRWGNQLPPRPFFMPEAFKAINPISAARYTSQWRQIRPLAHSHPVHRPQDWRLSTRSQLSIHAGPTRGRHIISSGAGGPFTQRSAGTRGAPGTIATRDWPFTGRECRFLAARPLPALSDPGRGGGSS